MSSSKQLVSALYLFVVTVIMVTLSWIGLADFDWYAYDELNHLPGEEVTADRLAPHLLLAAKVLQTTDRLESRWVGPAANTSKNHTAFNQILAHKDAALAFEYLLGADNVVAKVYAMHGFQQINENRFNQLKPFFSRNNQQIHIQSGCSGFFRPVSSVFDLSAAKHMTYFKYQQ
jgi:hypothetical protein